MTEMLEDNAKKRVARIPFPLCSTTSFWLLLTRADGAVLSKSVECCRKSRNLSNNVETCRTGADEA
jgi:hypothetical protein